MGSFKFLPDVATADIAFEAFGADLEDLFGGCARALFEIMAKVESVDSDVESVVEFENKDIERLLFDFLSEIVFLKDSEYMVFSDCDVKITKVGEVYKLKVVLKGEGINQEKQELGDDAKAITMHMFKIVKKKQGYRAVVVVDI